MTLFDLQPLVASTITNRSLRARKLAIGRIMKMHGKHGRGAEGQCCRGCAHLVYHTPGNRSFLKCELYGVTRSEASDWRAKWPACGQWKAKS